MKKYIVYWQDEINLCVTEVSSSKVRAKEVAKCMNNLQGFGNVIQEYDEFIKDLRTLRRCKDENWIDFSPTPKEVSESIIDFNYTLIKVVGIENIDYGDKVASIGITPIIRGINK